jgi:Flp pilus assembly protein TadG
MDTEPRQQTSTVQHREALGARPRRCPRVGFGTWQAERSGQAIVEFAIVSVAFFMLVFGTIDFGRAIFMYNQFHNAVREGARYGKIAPTDQTGIKTRVVAKASAFNVTTADVTVTCNVNPCTATSTYVEVTATSEFKAITQEFLGISPITMVAKVRVVTE